MITNLELILGKHQMKLDLLGASPEVGRAFDLAAHDAHQIVLSHTTWRRYFHASSSVVGSSIPLDGTQYVVAGIMPDWFRFPTSESAYWVPLRLDAGAGWGMDFIRTGEAV